MSQASRNQVAVPAATGTAFRLLGPLEVVRRGVLRDVPPGRQRALLAALLLRPNEMVSVPLLVEQVWGEAVDRSVLTMCVMRLRRSLEDQDHEVVQAEDGAYRIVVDEASVDLHRFRQLCAEAEQARDRVELEQERAALHEALELWRGEPLTGISSPVLQAEVVPLLEEERMGAIERRVEADLEYGGHAKLVRELRELVAEHPFRERFWHQLMVALHRSGRRCEALDAYRAVRNRFADELGVEPGSELRDLHQRILAADPTLLPYTTRSTTRSENSQPTTRVVPAHPSPAQLPPAIAGFSGRAGQLRELDHLLDIAGPVPVTLITGPPGVGKTALAVHWAGRSREYWPDGQLYVDLRGYAAEAAIRPIEALARFLQAAGVPADQVPNDLTAATALFRSLTVDKRMLVLLDNAANAEQVRPLLPSGRNCVAVVTSRDQLAGLVAREGARRLVLDVLPDAEARAVLAGVAGKERLAAEPEAANELVRLCGSLPLALRITAASLASYPERSVAEHVTELRTGNRLDTLELSGDNQAALRGTFRSSYARLAPPVQRMFRLLGLFPGPDVSTEAAAALGATSLEVTSRLLRALVSAHLVARHGPDRFVLHDLLRLYAAELARHEESEAVCDAAIQRLYDHYVRTAEAVAKRLYGELVRLPLSVQAARESVEFADHRQASSWLEAEWANLMALVQYAAVHGPHLDACRLAVVLRGRLHSKRNSVDWLTVARAGLAAARVAGDLRAQAGVHLSLADLHRCRDQHRAAVKHYQRALASSRRAGWDEGESAARNGLGSLFHMLGRPQPAIDHLQRAKELSHQAGRIATEAANLANLAMAQLHVGDVAQAIASLRRSLVLHKQVGSPGSESRTLAKLGQALNLNGAPDQARDVLHEAINMQHEMGDREYLPASLYELAVVHLDTGEHARAAELARTALKLARETVGGSAVAAGSIRVLGAANAASDRHDSALGWYVHAHALTRKAGLRHLHVQVLIGLASTYVELGRPGAARRSADRAVELAHRFGYHLLERHAAAVQSDVLSARYSASGH